MEAVANGTAAFPEYAGYIAAAVSCSFLGSSLLPVKKYDVGDGELCFGFFLSVLETGSRQKFSTECFTLGQFLC